MPSPFMRHLERRVDCRYEFNQQLRFTFAQHGSPQQGFGHTVELGGGSLLFQSDCPPPDGVAIELRILWPILVQGVCAVVLVIHGTVVRTDYRGTAVRMHRYAFQTTESHASDGESSSGVGCNLIG